MEFLNYIIIWINENSKIIIAISMFIMVVVQLFYNFYIFPRIDKKFVKKDEEINLHKTNTFLQKQDKEETLEDARIKYKQLLIEKKELEYLLKEKDKRINELEKIERKVIFEKNRKERNKNFRKETAKKGKDYELFIGNYYKQKGYEVHQNGIAEGRKDKGIDVICSKGNELVLIQCKNYVSNTKHKINHEKLKAFIGSCTEFINEKKLIGRDIKIKFVTSNDILDNSGRNFIEESKTLTYEILEIK